MSRVRVRRSHAMPVAVLIFLGVTVQSLLALRSPTSSVLLGVVGGLVMGAVTWIIGGREARKAATENNRTTD